MSARGLITIRRLPGLRFETQSPPLADSLPRMDVAVFIGFAAAGPVNQPVVIEDSAQFAEIFGEDAQLAWDAERGLMMRAYLGPTVRDFFRQGGRRCWIIRVARDAKYNYFPLPALLEFRSNGELLPAFARARSEGSWSDSIRVSTSLQTRPVEVTRASFAEHQFELGPNSPGDVQVGDLLRFKLRDEGYGLFGVVESANAVEPEIESPLTENVSARQRRMARRRSLRVQCAKPLWFNTHWLAGLSRKRVSPVTSANDDGSSGPLLEDVFYWILSDQGQTFTLHFKPQAVTPPAGARLLVDYFDAQLLLTVQAAVEGPGSPVTETVQVSGRVERLILPLPSQVLVFNNKSESRALGVVQRCTLESGKIKLICPTTLADAPPPGTLLRVDFGSRQLWLTVLTTRSIASGSSPAGSMQIEGEGFWRLTGPPVLPAAPKVEAERLNFDLILQETADKLRRLSDLGFDEKHSRYWGSWPTDEQRYQRMRTLAFIADPNRATERELFPLAESHGNTSDPISGKQNPSREVYLPVAMPFIADAYLGAIAPSQTPLERDGLATLRSDGTIQGFESDLFLDSAMLDTNLENLLSEADYLRYQSPTPRPLTGIYAALDIEEATIIAVPDAVHRNWTLQPEEQLQPGASDLLPHPRWWRYLDCNPPPDKTRLADEPAWENFLDCDLRIVPAPKWESEAQTLGGTIALEWSPIERATRYVVEESRNPSWNDSEVVYEGPQTRLVIYGRSSGYYFYRVRAKTAAATSEWSAGIPVRASITNQWVVEKKEEYNADALLDVQRALLRLCAARADLMAVLTMPEHYREDDAITHADILRPATGLPFNAPTADRRVAPLSLGEDRATSYGALYHPWLITRRDDVFEPWQVVPPDGASCGVMAQRAITRGAWIAPANELLRGVVALAPPLTAGRRLELQDAQINLIRHEPRGFLSLGADTLSRDVDLRPINVRRLLILLRRLALRLGETYVFEPNDDSFRRLIQRGFEAVLDQMFARGAFAGRTAATSYQVVTDESINTPRSVDQGRFIVELRVAPSLPLTFITVRLVQTNDRSLVTEGR
jgi:hypothetical protein